MQVSKYLDLAKANEDKEKYELLVDFLVPIVKSYPAEMGILTTSAAIQCLGGYGFCMDFPVQQYFRDIRIDTLHEGTTGIHGKDLLRRKATMKNGRAYVLFKEEICKAISEARDNPNLKIFADQLHQELKRLDDVTQYLLTIKDTGNIEKYLADATLYLEMASIIAVAWQWLLQALAATKALAVDLPDNEINFYNGKLYSFKYFFYYQLPKAASLANTLKNSNGLTTTMNIKFFEE